MKHNLQVIKAIVFLIILSSSLFATNYIKLSDTIVKQYVKQVAKPKHLYLTGEGGAMMGDIQKVILNFLSLETLTIDNARALYVEMMEEFLCRVNQNEKIRPYLHNYPFETDNFQLRLAFEDPQRNIISDGYVALLFITKNKILHFASYDPDRDKYYEVHQEPYAEALKIVQCSQKGEK